MEDLHGVIHEKCRFEDVIDGQLICEYGSHPFGSSEIAFRQQSIQAIRSEHNTTLIGLAVGAGAGAALGACRDSYPGIGRGGSALLGAGILGGLGALAGSVTGHFSHGKVIYRKPSGKTPPSGPSQTLDPESRTLASHDLDSGDEITGAERLIAPRRQDSLSEAEAPGVNNAVAPLANPRLRSRVPGSQEYPTPAYLPRWTPEQNLGHAVMGTALGFGFGAATGALGSIHGHTPVATGVVIGGSLFGFIGGAIGTGHGGPHTLMRRKRIYSPWPASSRK